MNKEIKLRNKVSFYGSKIGARHKKLNKMTAEFNSLRDEIVEKRAKKKEINEQLKTKHSHGEFITLHSNRKMLLEQIDEISLMLLYLNDAIGSCKREMKLLQQAQSMYIEKLNDYLNSINNIALKTT